EVVARHFTEARLLREAIGYWCRAGQLASERSANREAVNFFERALSMLEGLPETQPALEQAFEIRLTLRGLLNQLGEIRRMMECLRVADTLAGRLNDDERRGRVCALMMVARSQLGQLDVALTSGVRGLEIAGRLGDLK